MWVERPLLWAGAEEGREDTRGTVVSLGVKAAIDSTRDLRLICQ